MRLGRERFRLDAELVCGHFEVMREQVGNVARARAQRRQLDADHVEPVEEVLAKEAARDALVQILVGRGDDAHVDAHRGLAADPVELALGEHPQQARLQRHRHVADLIEEQRPAVGLLEAPAPERIRAGEGAALVSEELGLEEVGGNRRGVERDEGLAGARAVIVQRARHELLAGAGLAHHQHGHGGARQAADGAEHLLHRRRPTEELGNTRRAARLAACLHAGIGRAARERHGLVDVEGLRQVLERAALVGRHRAP